MTDILGSSKVRNLLLLLIHALLQLFQAGETVIIVAKQTAFIISSTCTTPKILTLWKVIGNTYWFAMRENACRTLSTNSQSLSPFLIPILNRISYSPIVFYSLPYTLTFKVKVSDLPAEVIAHSIKKFWYFKRVFIMFDRR